MENVPPPSLAPADEEHLRLLSIFHIVAGILYLIGGFLPIIHLVLGYMLVFQPDTMTQGQGGPPPALFGYIFMGFAVFAMICAWSLGVLTIYSGRCMRAKRSRMLSLVLAGLNCCLFPIGTALGVFTFIVLGRPSIRAAYESKLAPS